MSDRKQVVRTILEADVAIRCLKGSLTTRGIAARDFTLDEQDDARRVLGRLLDEVWVAAATESPKETP